MLPSRAMDDHGAVRTDPRTSALVPGLGAIVLCGGESARMGRPKAWLPFEGEPLLARVVRRASEAASPVVVVAAPAQDLPPLPPSVVLVRDAVSGRGPLQGLLAGLLAMASHAERAFVATTDAPFLHPAFVRRVASLCTDSFLDACVPRAKAHVHPLAAVYRVRVTPAISALLSRDQLRTMRLLDELRTRIVDEPDLLADPDLRSADPDLLSLRNLNTPEDYEEALALLP